MHKTKVFCIGLSKTGTTSLSKALEILGYQTVDNMGVESFKKGDITNSIDLNIIDANDAFTDTPIPSFYQELHQLYPNSKFILTIRDTDPWLKSCKKQFNQKLEQSRNRATNELFLDLYGTAVFDNQRFASGYNRFITEAKNYFSGSNDNFLIIDITKDKPWDKLCHFLGQQIPKVPFPKANVTKISWTNPERIKVIAEEAGYYALSAYNALHGTTIPLPRSSYPCTSLEKLRWLHLKLRHRGGKNANKAVNTTIKQVEKIIHKGLQKLNPDIPIITPYSNGISNSIRQRWNHYWLVDPLDGKTGFSNVGTAFSINIALIQDRSPIFGVIHAPTLATSYYGSAPHNIAKAVGGIPLALPPSRKDNNAWRLLTVEENNIATLLNNTKNENAISTGIQMYLAAIHPHSTTTHFPNTMEWQSAAAQVILQSMGFRLTNQQSGETPTYNTDTFQNNPLEIQPHPHSSPI